MDEDDNQSLGTPSTEFSDTFIPTSYVGCEDKNDRICLLLRNNTSTFGSIVHCVLPDSPKTSVLIRYKEHSLFGCEDAL